MRDQSAMLVMYATYMLVSVTMTVWVAKTLAKHGHLFLVDVFGGDRDKAEAVNHLLVVGFYLVNLGFVCFQMSERGAVIDAVSAAEMLSTKVGIVLAVLGGMHFFNLYVFSRMRCGSQQRLAPLPPVLPRGRAVSAEAMASVGVPSAG